MRSRCPVTQLAVSLIVGHEGMRRADPAGSVVSFLSAEQPWAGGDVVATFCRYVRFLASPTAGAGWVRQHPGMFLMSLNEAFVLGRKGHRAEVRADDARRGCQTTRLTL